MADCKDELDEKECRVVEFPTQQQYKKSLPPIQRKEDGSITKTEVVIVIVNHDYENITYYCRYWWGCISWRLQI